MTCDISAIPPPLHPLQLSRDNEGGEGGAVPAAQDTFLPRRTTYVYTLMGSNPDAAAAAAAAADAYAVLPILVTRSKGE